MPVRAKFQVYSVVETKHRLPHAQTVHETKIALQPVYGGNPENEKFFAATPSGNIELSLVHPDVAEQFVPGQEYYIDFTPADNGGE